MPKRQSKRPPKKRPAGVDGDSYRWIWLLPLALKERIQDQAIEDGFWMREWVLKIIAVELGELEPGATSNQVKDWVEGYREDESG